MGDKNHCRTYISGPMTGLPEYNYPAFHAAAKRLRDNGHTIVSPAELCAIGVSWRDAMVKNIRALLGCQKIVLLPGWQKSKGAKLERAIGIAFDMEIEELEPCKSIKRLSISRRVELIFAFFRDAAGFRFNSTKDRLAAKDRIFREVQRQIENAVRDDRELRDGVPIELSNEELCPACGIPGVEHGSIKAGQWDIRVCAGVAGQNLYVIGQDAAEAFVEQLKEKHERREQPAATAEPANGQAEVHGS